MSAKFTVQGANTVDIIDKARVLAEAACGPGWSIHYIEHGFLVLDERIVDGSNNTVTALWECDVKATLISGDEGVVPPPPSA